jgi:hypothetical protein
MSTKKPRVNNSISVSANTPLSTQSSTSPNEDRSINRGMMYATWISVVVAIIAVASSFYFFWALQNATKERLAITGVQRITIAPTQLRQSVVPTNARSTIYITGILSAHWKVFLSNNSDKDISVIRYCVLQVSSKDYPAVSYTDMDQGLFW